jgi:GAF domain-containing protein
VSDASKQLHLLADIGRSLATFIKIDDLVQYATRRTRELFDAEGCALLILDRDRGEFRFPVASQRDAGAVSAAELAEVRFPADQGIAGWVLAHDEATMVADTAKDPRFYDAVDRRTAMHTRSLLCAPLRTRGGNIGVIEVVNPSDERLDAGDLEFLDILASEIGVAYEKAALYRELEREVIDLRRFLRAAGVVLAAIGVMLAIGAAFYHRARVLPWSELPNERGILLGVVCTAIGAGLFAAGKGWVLPPRRPAR